MREQQTNPLQSCHFVMLKCVYMYDNMVVYSPNGNWTKLIFINRDLWRLADNDFNTKMVFMGLVYMYIYIYIYIYHQQSDIWIFGSV